MAAVGGAAVAAKSKKDAKDKKEDKYEEKEKIKDHADLERINREITILKKVRHNNVV